MGSNCSNQQKIKIDVAELCFQDIEEPSGCATLENTYTRPYLVSFPSDKHVKDQHSTDVEHPISQPKKPRVKLTVNKPKKQSIDTMPTKCPEAVTQRGILKTGRCHSSDHFIIDRHVRFTELNI